MGTKVIAMYLPQYHSIPENDLWWGEGYTDWEAVKTARPLFEGHEEPRVPYENNYYDLSNPVNIRKQAEIAKNYGVYGFGIYHYWFSSKQILLDKPAYLIKDDKEIEINYFFMWDNGNWKRTWSNVKFSNSWAPLMEKGKEGPEILAELIYGDENEWRKHFEYLLPFFLDNRYIKIQGKPVFGIFNQNNKPDLLTIMFKYWNEIAPDYGLPGVLILGKSNASNIQISQNQFDYEPATHGWVGKNNIQKAFWRIKNDFKLRVGLLKKYRYTKIWKRILSDVSKDPNYQAGAFVRYDDTPRRGKRGMIVTGESPELFEKYMSKLLRISNKYYKEFIFLTAWNEWGEGAYLEPDTKDGYAYLEALKRAIDSVDSENA